MSWWSIIFQAVMTFMMTLVIGMVIADGTFCPLKHKWDSISMKYDIDLITLKVTPESYTEECVVCHKKRNIKPGTRKWEKRWDEMTFTLHHDRRWQDARLAKLLEEGYEIDIASGMVLLDPEVDITI